MTTQTKHTPGPWRYHLGRGATPRFHIQTEGGYQIASTTELTTPRTAKLAADFDENQAREANARLIATAPELLYHLEACLHYAETPGDFSKEEAYDMMDDCAKAIAKARGEA